MAAYVGTATRVDGAAAGETPVPLVLDLDGA